MLSDEIRARLQLLHPARHVPARDVQRAIGSSAAAASFSIDDHLGDAEEVETGSGTHLRFRRDALEFWPAGVSALSGVADRGMPPRITDAHPELDAVASHFPRATLFLDLETCGFAGSMVFLVGLIRSVDGRIVIEQLFARDYGEERAVLETLWRAVDGNSVLVTFNGKTFDWPMVHDRSTRHRLLPASSGGPRRELVHCDLLHHARRRWKRVLPNCKLQTLERYVCRRWRRGDLSGDAVPAAYHAFVRSGQTDQVRAILHHNALDLVTLMELTWRMFDGAQPLASAG